MRSISGWSQSAIETRPTRFECDARLARELEDAIGGKRPDGQVVVARPAESAEVGAAADDFDQEARAEFGVGREDAGRRRIDRIGRLHRRLSSPAAARRRLAHRDSRPACRRPRTAARRETGCRSRARRRAGAAGRRDRSRRRRARRRPGTSTSPSPAVITSANSASGSGLTNVTAPPITISGWRGDRSARVARQAGQPQQRQHVGVVPLERHREREDVEVADRRLRFERDQRRPGRRSSASSCFGGRKNRSQTMSSSALNSR